MTRFPLLQLRYFLSDTAHNKSTSPRAMNTGRTQQASAVSEVLPYSSVPLTKLQVFFSLAQFFYHPSHILKTDFVLQILLPQLKSNSRYCTLLCVDTRDTDISEENWDHSVFVMPNSVGDIIMMVIMMPIIPLDNAYIWNKMSS